MQNRAPIHLLILLISFFLPGAFAQEEPLVPAISWHWQLTGEVQPPIAIQLVDLDLFEVSASKINAIKSGGSFILCYFSAGTFENWRNDLRFFDKAALGKPMDDWEGETWWDIRHPDVRALILNRMDLAVEKGCDGIEPDNVDAFDNDNGLDLTKDDAETFLKWIADQAHRRGLKIALKNTNALVQTLAPIFDMAVTEQCFEYDECNEYLPFITLNKPVLNAEYAETTSHDQQQLCAQSRRLRISTLILPLELDNSFRISCNPDD